MNKDDRKVQDSITHEPKYDTKNGDIDKSPQTIKSFENTVFMYQHIIGNV